jgi:hypothetical protein
MALSVYVDDSLMSGLSLREIRLEMEAILKHFKGKEVMPSKIHDDGTEERDLLGATLLYNQAKRYMKLHMAVSIAKVLKKFLMEGCKSISTPCAPYSDLSSGQLVEAFPMRQLVGALLWLAVMSRPDLSFAVQKLAQFADKPTTSAITAGKRILKYISGTPELGIEYSPENEAEFRRTYQNVLDEHNGESSETVKQLPDHVGFCDSDFAGDTITLRSTSGSVIYFRGTAIAWSSKKQTIRALSTTEAEYCSMYDCIRVTQSHGFLNWYLGSGAKLPLIFADNQSAIAISKAKFPTKKSKHFALRYMLVKDNFKSFGYCPSHLNLSDPLTKGLSGPKYDGLFNHGGDQGGSAGYYAVGLNALVDLRNLW